MQRYGLPAAALAALGKRMIVPSAQTPPFPAAFLS
jgi:hypothetical protein